MALSIVERKLLREKFEGRCAYCGGVLGERWHADHIEHVERELKHVPGRGFIATGKMHRPERDTLENLTSSPP